MPKKAAPTSDGPAEVSKSARTRGRILDAAARTLSRNGYSGTTLAAVARAADVQAPAIYYYFSSRDQLVEEVMLSGVHQVRAEVEHAVATAPPGTDAIGLIMIAVETHLRFAVQASDYTTASIRNSGQLPPAIRDRQRAEEKRYGAVWRGLFTNAAAEGSLRPGLDLLHVQMLAIGALNYAVEWWRPSQGSLKSVVDSAQQFVRRAIEA